MPTLAEIEPGTLFRADGVYAVKSEYVYPSGWCECILLASGEYAYFPRGNDTPVEIIDLVEFYAALSARALEAANAASNRMRAALVEAQQELARGQIMHAQAAIRRGLGEEDRL